MGLMNLSNLRMSLICGNVRKGIKLAVNFVYIYIHCLFFFSSLSCRINHCNSHPCGSGCAAWSSGQHLLLPKEGMVNACVQF